MDFFISVNTYLQKYLKISAYLYIFKYGDLMDGKQKVSLNIDSELWHKFRIKTLQEKKTATEVVESLISNYVEIK